MADCAFKRLEIWHMSRGGTEICWTLSENLHVRGTMHFYVDFGWPGTDEWIALNEDPIVDDCCFTDPCQRHWEKLSNGFYRVRMLLPDEEGCPVYISTPSPADGSLDKKDWLIAREIVRKELLQQSKIDGTPGFLLKRKKFGPECPNPDCLEWDTREVTDSNCPICYGTGITGGYYAGIEHYMTLQSGGSRRIDAGSPPRGVSADMNDVARSILYPRIDTRDVWVASGSDARYIIDGYSVVVDIKGLSLVGNVQLKLAPATDVVYSIPVEGTPPLESSVESPACDVRKGLNATYEDW